MTELKPCPLDKIDRKFLKLGYVKEEDNEWLVIYKKYINEYNYTHRLDIISKQSGKHLIQSYQEGVNSDGFNNNVGIPENITKLALKKLKCKKKLWNRRVNNG